MKKRQKRGMVLVVDDDPAIHRLFQKALSQEGHQVLKALSGEEALKLLDKGPIDLVLLDIVMPGKSGIDTLREIKRHLPQLPVIMITGHGELDTARQAMLLGAYDYVTKPFDLDFVKGLILKALGESPRSKGHG